MGKINMAPPANTPKLKGEEMRNATHAASPDPSKASTEANLSTTFGVVKND